MLCIKFIKINLIPIIRLIKTIILLIRRHTFLILWIINIFRAQIFWYCSQYLILTKILENFLILNHSII